MIFIHFSDNTVEEDETISSSISPISDDDLLLLEREELGREAKLKREKHQIKSNSWIHGILDMKDLIVVNPIQVWIKYSLNLFEFELNLDSL